MRAGELPLMVENRLGSGKLLFVATAADRGWSDWPQDRLYVPMIRQMLAWLTGQSRPREPSGAVGKVQLGSAGPPVVRTELIAAAGQRAGIETRDGVTLVRNIDPQESLLHRVTEAEFRQAFGLPDQPPRIRPTESALIGPTGAQRPDEAWSVVVWLLLAVLSVETLLASRVHA
jgi:hypothetical protein